MGTQAPRDADELRATLTAMEAELHAARGELATFAATLGHDLNNTLGTIRGFAELLSEDPDVDGRTRRTAERIQSSADRSLRTVERAVAEARARVVATAPDRVDLGQVLTELGEARAEELAAAGVTLDIAATPVVPGLREKIEAILGLVLDNVVAHTPGATLQLHTDSVATDRLIVELRDDGPGFDARDADRVFEPGVTLSGDGDGNGLATVRRLTEEHGGRAWITTSPGQGVTVHLAFPTGATAVVDG